MVLGSARRWRPPAHELVQRPTAGKIERSWRSLILLLSSYSPPERQPNGCTTKLIVTRAMLRHTPGRTAVRVFEEIPGRRSAAKLLSKDEARRIAAGIAKLRSWCVTSTARAKSAIGRLDFNLTIVLSAGGEPECAARSLNNRGASAFVWIIRKLVEPNL